MQVWVGTPDLQQLHLQWYDLVTSATCQGLACTLPLAASFAPGEYVVYIQPWGPDGFIVNDLEGWLGPQAGIITTDNTVQPTPTENPIMSASRDVPQSAGNMICGDYPLPPTNPGLNAQEIIVLRGACRESAPSSPVTRIFILSTQTGTIYRVPFDQPSGQISDFMLAPAISANGEWIVALNSFNTPITFFLYNTQTGSVYSVDYPNSAELVSEVVWSPDGTQLAYIRTGQVWVASFNQITGDIDFANEALLIDDTQTMDISYDMAWNSRGIIFTGYNSSQSPGYNTIYFKGDGCTNIHEITNLTFLDSEGESFNFRPTFLEGIAWVGSDSLVYPEYNTDQSGTYLRRLNLNFPTECSPIPFEANEPTLVSLHNTHPAFALSDTPGDPGRIYYIRGDFLESYLYSVRPDGSSSSFALTPEDLGASDVSVPQTLVNSTITVDSYIAELATYGVEVIYDGNFYDEIRVQELENLLSGVERVADALEILGVAGSSRQDRFRSAFISSTVGGPDLTITFLRLPPSDVSQPANTPFGPYYSGTVFSVSENCLMNDAPDNISETKQGYVVACRGIEGGDRWSPQPSPSPVNWHDGLLTTEAVIHELGHIIDVRSNLQLRSIVTTRNLFDCRVGGIAIMRFNQPQVDVTNRGEAGWGSYSSGENDISQFQQNAADTTAETTADMFLNWVYRITSDTVDYFDPSVFRTLPDSQKQAFLCGYTNPDPNRPSIPPIAADDNRIQLAYDASRTEWEQTNWTGFLNFDSDIPIDVDPLFAEEYNNQGILLWRREHLPGNARYIRIHVALETILQIP